MLPHESGLKSAKFSRRWMVRRVLCASERAPSGGMKMQQTGSRQCWCPHTRRKGILTPSPHPELTYTCQASVRGTLRIAGSTAIQKRTTEMQIWMQFQDLPQRRTKVFARDGIFGYIDAVCSCGLQSCAALAASSFRTHVDDCAPDVLRGPDDELRR